MEKMYAQALYVLSQEPNANASELVRKLVESLKEHGRSKLLPGIARELSRMEARNAKHAPIVEVAHKKDEHAALAEAAKYGIEVPHAHVNHELISGWRASSYRKLIDQTGKRALIDIYRNSTTI